MKQTLKALRAAMIIGAKYGVSLSHVLGNETTPENMYLELRADGYVWSTALKRWLMNAKKLDQQPPETLKTMHVQVRLITEDAASANVAAGYITDALHDAGFKISREPRVTENRTGGGARAYFEVEL